MITSKIRSMRSMRSFLNELNEKNAFSNLLEKKSELSHLCFGVSDWKGAMTTLIAAYNSSGCCGRCDAKCYNATEPDCTCICGGMNHGAGKLKAIENTNELAESWMQEYEKQHQVDKWLVPSLQRTLPGFEEQRT